ncbi:unnamed protein product [Brassica rapa]|uniref:Uncharacterized protein n=1 Tax=Brassica campestris TaxID=3711 RepID=A0A3P5ZZA2_BRACM|nr:unnamed protein product [Brassica rapa]VDC77821.1 unnamed protein product [Brassica rapa]
MLNHDRDEELSMFLEMRRREKEHRGESLLTGSDNVSINGALTTAVSAALSGISSETVPSQRYPLRRTAAENFLYSENEKSDYDWLLTPPGTPQFEKESHRSVMNQLDAPNSRPTVLKSRLGNCGEEMISRNNDKTQMSSASGPSSVSGLRRPSSSCSSRSTSRPSTPTTRSTSRPSTPTRRSTTTNTSTTRPVTTTRASTSRSSTPTSRATLTASRATTSISAPRTTTSTGSARSATPTRSKTQPSSAPSKKPLSRPATPTRRPSTPTGPSIVSSKAPSRGTSPAPTVKSSRPQKPPEMPGFSLEAPPNLRTTLSDRPVSARGRPGVASAPGSRSSSIERGSGGMGHSRRQSCSPSRGHAPVGNTNGSLPGARVRGKAYNDSFSPVAMGNKMVERVVNMRKLGPPRLTENGGGRGTVKSNSAFNTLGYGRNLSKSSIDMALRHMDIRRGMTGNLRPLVTKVPASAMYSVRSRSTSVTNSPVATSSTISSSELMSVDNINILCLDGNDDLLSERSFS